MSGGAYLRALLEPLGIYNLEGTFNGGELDAVGDALDGPMAELDDLALEMTLATAQSWGLEKIAELMMVRPVTSDASVLAESLAALVRIGQDSFTLADINDTVVGCGLNAVVSETDTPGYVTVHFPDVPGIPEDFDQISTVIEAILPAHVGIEYIYWYITWVMAAEQFGTWGGMADSGKTWYEIPTSVG